MMSRISGNQTNSEQPNASVSGVKATTTDLASAAAFNKQRKKRKKKKDKILLTNRAANCNCGKRIESRCNSVSTCSNCVPSACVYCHFNDLAYRENDFAEPSTRIQCDLFDTTIKTNSPINFWTQQIENNDIPCDVTNETHNTTNYFMRHHRNVSLNRRTEQLQRFAVYENLCEFCGFAIGNGAYHLHCDANRQNIHTNNNNQPKPENIYENICESCHAIFDGEQCISETCKRNNKTLTTPIFESVPITGEVIDVLVKKPPIANRQFGKQFSEFLGSFKQKLSSKTSETVRKRPKIEIIHNTDDVFKTNKTFDLNEIIQLRNESLSVNQTQSACHELRNSCNEIVTEAPPKPIRLCRTSTSDSNFLENYFLSPSHLQSPFSESIVSDTVLYSNSYAPPSYEDAIQNSKYASVNPFKLRSRIKPSIHDSTSASSFFTYNSSESTLQSDSFATDRKSDILSSLEDSDDSVKQWLTSIKQQTHEYVNDNRQFECGSTKCLPSKILNESASNLKWSIEHGDNMNSTNQANNTQPNLLRRIELFKENLLEHRMHSKRNAIYIKDSICDAFDATMPPDTIAPDIETTPNISTSLLPYRRQNHRDNVERCDDIVCLRRKNQLTPSVVETQLGHASHEPHINHNVAFEATSQYLQMLKLFYMAQVTLSTGLNRITLVCGDRRIHFFVKYLVKQPQNSLNTLNKLVQPTRYTNFQQIIELIYKMSRTNQLGECDKGEQINRSIDRFEPSRKRRPTNGFLMRSTNQPLRTPLRSRHKRSMDDFAKRKHQTPCIEVGKTKTLDDYSKPSTKDSNISGKSLNDFAKKISDYSSSATDSVTDGNTKSMTIVESTEQNSIKQNDEDIYQSIWMFKTVGSAIDTTFDEDSLNNFDTCEHRNDDTIIHDANEWEIAQEEFLFSSQRIDTVHELTDTRQMSHATDTEFQLSKVNADGGYKLNDKTAYQTICVLYNTAEPKWNEIIYDYNGNSIQFNANITKINTNETPECNRMARIMGTNEANGVERKSHAFSNSQEIAIKLDSVNAWKAMLRAVDYIDDEEDVILTESYLLNQKSAEYNNRNNDNIQCDSVSDTTKSSIQSDKTEETDLLSDLSVNSSAPSSSPTGPIESKNKKESGFLNKLQYRRFDISKNNTKKDDMVQGLFYKNLNGKMHAEPSPPMEIKRLNQIGTIVFGTTLDEVEKDDKLTDIPKFVVECMKVIEIEENMQTNGIYRASGKKDSIDKLRKRMNESKLRKGTKYVSLKDEDVHTVTGSLKQFFRELKTELIPENIVKNLPNDLESEASLVSIRNAISTIDYLSRETLKYLLQHLIRVDANREHNLMNASNLSIVWGASLFTSSVSITNAFETSDLMRRNTLIKVLIQRYDDIFIDTDRLI